MRKSAIRSLRSLLTESAPIRRLPDIVIRQLVGYYGDWRRSRDIMNDADEGSASTLSARIQRASYRNSTSQYHAR